MGINSPLPNYPSTLLGAVNLSPMDMLGIYQVLATGGLRHEIHTIRTIIDDQGRVVQGMEQKISKSSTPRLPISPIMQCSRSSSKVPPKRR